MYNPSAERSAGWSGLAFIALAIASTIVMGAQPPGVTASPAVIGAFLLAHNRGVLGWAWLGFPLAAFFLWFAAGLRASLRQAAGSPDGLPLYGIMAAHRDGRDRAYEQCAAGRARLGARRSR